MQQFPLNRCCMWSEFVERQPVAPQKKLDANHLRGKDQKIIGSLRPVAPKPISPYSQAVRANGFLFSAQITLDPNTNAAELPKNALVEIELIATL